MPIPVSAYREVQSDQRPPSRCSVVDPNHDLALFGELDRVPHQVDDNLTQSAQRRQSAHRAHSTGMSHASSRPFSSARSANVSSIWPRLSRKLKPIDSSSNRPASILEKSRMSLRSASSESADSCTMPRNSRCSAAELRVQGEIGHSDDGVHRRADLVTHIRQKLTFRAARRLGGFLRLLQFRFRSLASSHIQLR